ncbi:uncharacterized protein LOC135470328 isoform X2 [Liolophura sinensis]|uniref:uncharacterized protein LOC135470328 isoform X2 n=1 Tax=Liolophura sinensis TaxID=3198878 RepID=UPI003158DBA6
MEYARSRWPIALVLLDTVYFVMGSGCSFPPEWQGDWYQNALGDVRITTNEISSLGTCVQNVDSKYLVKSSSGHYDDQDCYRCLVVTPQHENIIEYKRSYCREERNIADVCSTITGDYQLYTMIRVPSTPVPCPFQGPFQFTYTNMSTGNKVCEFPVSEVHACADDSRFKFRFRKCQDMPYTSTAEYDFQCLATWSAKNYLFGKFTNPNMYDKAQMYRCFIHNFQVSPAEMAMSPDASCRGVTSSVGGALNMKFTQDKEKWPTPMCDFPDFFTAERRWRDLSGRFIIHVDANGQRFKLMSNHVSQDVVRYTEESVEAKYSIKCIDKIDEGVSLSQFEYRTFTTNDSCISQYQCLKIYKRSPKVIELYIGSKLRNERAACEQHNFANSTRYVFIPADSAATPCPLAGSYKFKDKSTGCSGNFKVGCGFKAEEIQIETACPNNEQNEILQCLHTWTEDHNIHVIVEKPGDPAMTGTCVTFGEDSKFRTVSTEQECNFMLPQILGKRITYQLMKPPETCKRDPRTLEGSTNAGVIRDMNNVLDGSSATSLDSISHVIWRKITLTLGFVIVLFTDRLCLR